jgi:hypothetical protein
MNNDQWLDPNVDRRPDANAGPDLRRFLPPWQMWIAAIGLAILWYLIIPGFMYINARDNEIHIENYATVQAMDNAVTHEYIIECLEDGIITWREYSEIRKLTEKYPVIEKITRERR